MAYWSGGHGSRWAPYVPVAKRREQVLKSAKNREKSLGRKLAPITLEGRKIASSFWGKAWCDNLERYSDYSNRLPRGRRYVRNGSVIDLDITKGKIVALVSGSSVYTVEININTLPTKIWKEISRDCATSITSLIDLLQGRFEEGVMQRLTRSGDGLFPSPKEIKMSCSCPDWATMCKHVAAVMYGVGSRLDKSPELLFTLRHVDHSDLMSQAVQADNLNEVLGNGSFDQLRTDDLGEIFGIELETQSTEPRPTIHKGHRVSKPKGKPAATKKLTKTKRSAKLAGPKKRASLATKKEQALKSKPTRTASKKKPTRRTASL